MMVIPGMMMPRNMGAFGYDSNRHGDPGGVIVLVPLPYSANNYHHKKTDDKQKHNVKHNFKHTKTHSKSHISQNEHLTFISKLRFKTLNYSNDDIVPKGTLYFRNFFRILIKRKHCLWRNIY